MDDKEEQTKQGGTSWGPKLLLGCLALSGLGLVLAAVALTAGGFLIKRGIESATGSVGEHREASRILARLESEHPFHAPADGVVTEEELVRYLEVTDRAWDDLEEWAGTLDNDRAPSTSQGASRLRDLWSGAKALSGGVRARVVLAESLESVGMSLGEYAWTGVSMDRAARASRGGYASDVPAANLSLMERYGPRIPRLERSSEDTDTTRGAVLAVAVLWGMTEVPTWRALGLDSVRVQP